MKLFLVILVLSLVSSVNVTAQNEATVTLTLYEDGQPLWFLKNIKGDIDNPGVPDRIRVLADKKKSLVLCEYVPLDVSFFTGAKILKLSKYPRPLLATNWVRGARTPCLRIFDPTLGKTALLAEYCSIDLKYEVQGDHIDISEFRYKSQDDSTLIEMRTEWSPIEESKATPSGNPSVPQNQ